MKTLRPGVCEEVLLSHVMLSCWFAYKWDAAADQSATTV